jgi:SH3-like domain-containing protein
VKLYDFSVYAARRDAKRKEAAAAARVVAAMEHIEEPGSVKQLKHCVDDWFTLHRNVIENQA